MSKPSVLIVGAGAVGLAVGYHLSLAEASITFLVRPRRSAACASPQQLYCYDDAELKTFAGYSVVENVAELAEMRFQFVIVTLDGHSSRTTEGTALLRSLGDAIRASDAMVIMGGVALDLREHYLKVMRIAEDRLLAALLGMLSHQANANLPVHAPTDPLWSLALRPGESGNSRQRQRQRSSVRGVRNRRLARRLRHSGGEQGTLAACLPCSGRNHGPPAIRLAGQTDGRDPGVAHDRERTPRDGTGNAAAGLSGVQPLPSRRQGSRTGRRSAARLPLRGSAPRPTDGGAASFAGKALGTRSSKPSRHAEIASQ